MQTQTISVPPALRRGARQTDQAAAMASAANLLQLICRYLEVSDLDKTRLLDMGCGTKLVEAILSQNIPIQHYSGIDVYRSTLLGDTSLSC